LPQRPGQQTLRSESEPDDSGTPANDLDLSPASPLPTTSATPTPRKRVRNWVMMGVVVLALGAILFQALTSARVFFYNVDEAVAQRDEIGDSTFRIQGTVVEEPVTDTSGALVFTIGFNGTRATVRHIGEEPTNLFELGVPVVAEGHWQGSEFESTQVLVKHSEAYVAENDQRPGVGDGTYEVESQSGTGNE